MKTIKNNLATIMVISFLVSLLSVGVMAISEVNENIIHKACNVTAGLFIILLVYVLFFYKAESKKYRRATR